MKLLIFSQKVDKNDSVLGFFHTWLMEISKRAESVTVICLYKGEVNLPKNVTVYSLGKEKGLGRFEYLKNLFKYLHSIGGLYDNVFVHMNQEYVLLGGLYWKLKGIPIYLWRNHPDGSILTRLSVSLSSKVFCTSPGSFTAKYKKTVIMPAGIDTNMFGRQDGIVRKKHSVCMVGRISPIKHIELGLEAVNFLISSGGQISLSIVGSAADFDMEYYNMLQLYVAQNNMTTSVSFVEAVSPERLSDIYNSYEICLNLTESGSFDKTIVEASACGAIPLVSNTSLTSFLPAACITESTASSIALSLQKLLDAHIQLEIQDELKVFVQSQSLGVLMERLFAEMGQ